MKNLSNKNLVPGFSIWRNESPNLCKSRCYIFFQCPAGERVDIPGGEPLGVTRHNSLPLIVGSEPAHGTVPSYDGDWIFGRIMSDFLKIKTYKAVYLCDYLSAATVFLTFQYMLQCHLSMRKRGTILCPDRRGFEIWPSHSFPVCGLGQRTQSYRASDLTSKNKKNA